MAAAFTRNTALTAGNPVRSGRDIDDEAGPSGVRPTRKRAAAEPHLNKPAKKVAEWEAKQQHKAIER